MPFQTITRKASLNSNRMEMNRKPTYFGYCPFQGDFTPPNVPQNWNGQFV